MSIAGQNVTNITIFLQGFSGDRGHNAENNSIVAGRKFKNAPLFEPWPSDVIKTRCYPILVSYSWEVCIMNT